MSLPKRYVELLPTTTLAEVSRLIDEEAGDVEVRVGSKLLLVHQSDVDAPAKDEKEKFNAVDNLLKYAGMWEGVPEIEEYLEWREEQKKLDIERQERLWK